MKKINFVTVFPEAFEQHLEKDVGKIPQILAKHYEYSCALATEGKIKSKPKNYLTIENLPPRPSIKKWGIYISAILYIKKYAKQIDILNLYHLSLGTKINAILYKILNKKGILYIKLDLNIQDEEAELSKPTKKRSLTRKVIGNWFNKKFFSTIDHCSAESESAVKIASKRYPKLKNKLIEIPNGLEVSALNPNIEKIIANKKNLIICVGRIGAPEKNYELILKTLNKINILDWEFAFIGPYTQNFKNQLESLTKTHPHLKNKIKLTGNISDRKTLMHWYEKAKVLAITSLREGFPSVISEAQCNGVYILSTNVSCAPEYVGQGIYGSISKNDEEFEKKISEIISKNIYNQNVGLIIANYARKKYDWRENLKTLVERIELS